MSMTTLGAQLAALNSSQGGSAIPTSRRHEDAVGRGLHHSVQVGHSLVGHKSHIFKASILYQDARQASNVPLTTLQENCVAALEELETVDPVFGQFVTKLCRSSTERGLLKKTENDEIDLVIQDLLYRLALRMTCKIEGVDTITCGLNIVEYLIRQYDLYLRPKLVSTMLLVWLPHHEHSYFLRWLQLVDLANLPTWAWLRPYAIPNAKVGRDAIAKAVSKNVALCRDVLQLSTKSAALPEADATLSFTAAVLVEAMALQQRSKGTIEERTCLALLPTIRRACLSVSRNALFANWGYVLASTIVETSCLADEPRKGLVTSILQGFSQGKKNVSEGDTNMQDADENSLDDGTIQNALILVMALLQQQPSNVDSSNNDEASNVTCQLAVGTKKILYGFSNTSCIDSKGFWQALLMIDTLPSRLAALLVDEGFVDVIHWITSLWVLGWNRLEKMRLKSSSKQMALEKFLTELLQEPRIATHILSKPEWIEALVCFVLMNSIIDENSLVLQSILGVLRRKSISAYEQGITQALLRSKRQARSHLAKYLGLAAESDSKTNGKENASIQLPPRVALDHADVEFRLEAIDRILADDQDEDDSMGMESTDESVAEVLMRRVLLDEDIQVASKASKALCDLLDKEHDKKNVLISMSFANNGLKALYKWTEWSQSDQKAKSSLMCHLLHLNSQSTKMLNDKKGSDILLVQLVEALGAHLVQSDLAVSKEAAKGIVAALTGKRGAKASDNEARQLLISHNNELLHQFVRTNQDLPRTAQILRRRLVPSILKAYSETLSQRSAKNNEDETLKTALAYCLWTVTEHGKNLASHERALLLTVFKRTAGLVAANPKRLSSTFGTVMELGETLFVEVICAFVIEVVTAIKDKKGKTVPSLAVLMELTLRPCTSSESVERLLAIAKKLAPLETSSSHLALVPALALLKNPDAGVRKEVIGLFSILGEQLEKCEVEEWRQLSVICKYITENEATAIMGSPSFLPTCLQFSASQSKNGKSLPESLFKLTRCSISTATTVEALNATNLRLVGWLDLQEANGGHFASHTFLVAAEAAGEAAFPLLTRWSNVGKPLLELASESDLSSIPSPTLMALLDHATLMLKGVKGLDKSEKGVPNSNVIIMSGPGSTGGRNRSYSFSKSESTNFLSPYPNEMTEMIVTTLSAEKIPRSVRNILLEHVLASASWGNHIFSKLPQSQRQEIISTVLNVMIEDLADFAETAFFALPIPCQDISQILEKQSTAGSSLASLTYVADYTGSNSQRLAADLNVSNLLAVLFEQFSTLSLKESEDGDGVEFARTSLLDALTALLEAIPTDLGEKLSLNKKKKFKAWISSLVGSLGSDQNSEYSGLHSVRNKKSVLSVLASMCSLYPSRITEEIIPAVVTMVSATTSEKDASIVAGLLGSIVPVYFKYSSKANLAVSDLMYAFIAAANHDIDSSTRLHLYRGFVDSISKTEQTRSTDFIGVFLAICLASDIFYNHAEGRPQSSQLAPQVLNQVAVTKRVQGILTLTSYSRDLVLKMGGDDAEKTSVVITTDVLCTVAQFGPIKGKMSSTTLSSTDHIQRKLCSSLMAAICEIVASPPFAKYLRHCRADSSELVVRLWQDLLLIQSVCNTQLATFEGENSAFWASMAELTNETLQSIQLHLPSPIFLAFVTSLVKESESEDLRARALQLVAERSLMIDASDPEAYLFLDMLPYLSSLLENEGSITTTPLLEQSALVAIEHITRRICFEGESLGSTYLDTVSKALVKTAGVIERLSGEVDFGKPQANGLDNTSVQLLCTATLCAATSVRACSARAIPSLPHLLRPSAQLLGKVNSVLNASPDRSIDENQARILQLSLLRLIASVVESIPQFLSPYLGDLLNANVLPSTTIRTTDDDQSLAVSAATVKLCEALSLKVPARQLLIPLTTALTKSDTPASIVVLMDIMTMSIKNSKAAELVSKANSILKAGTFVYDYSGEHGRPNALIVASTNMFIALILKLSELQLRSLYSKLRAWRGEFDKANPNGSASRRYCFWFLSASLGLELKSIFLPCLGSVFTDAVDELDAAATFLCKRTKVNTAGGTKKQRIEADNSLEYNSAAILSLRAVLKCLEVSLRSDAHDGGSWIRDGESERFDVLLEPLGKLFTCRVDGIENGALSYQDIVQDSDDESGSVVECIVALASAAGEEQKWKPLNHAVLQACSHESRPEVRQAGVRCLLSLIRSIGEEYMVLIPECLPVLSELLEDTDEQTAGLAQECITVSEELLGESLEENLR